MFCAVNSSKEELWQSRMRRFQIGGMSVTQFCRVEGVSMPSFYQWRKRLAVSLPKNGMPAFVPVRVTQAAAVEIHLPNGARVCVPPGDVASLRLAIETVGRLESDIAGEVQPC